MLWKTCCVFKQSSFFIRSLSVVNVLYFGRLASRIRLPSGAKTSASLTACGLPPAPNSLLPNESRRLVWDQAAGPWSWTLHVVPKFRQCGVMPPLCLVFVEEYWIRRWESFAFLPLPFLTRVKAVYDHQAVAVRVCGPLCLSFLYSESRDRFSGSFVFYWRTPNRGRRSPAWLILCLVSVVLCGCVKIGLLC